MSAISFRTADKKDAEAILKTLEGAFRREKGSEKWENNRGLILEEPENWRLLSEDDQILGAVHAGKSWLKIGKTQILKGDVGHISILPAHQGKGYGSKLMANTVEWMKTERYDISRLGGLVEFYSRFGYLRFPRRYVEISVGNKVAAGASLVEEGRILLKEELASKIRPFNPEKDFPSYVECHNNFNSRYNGSILISPQANPPKSNPLSFIFEENGKVSGYLFASQHPAEYGKSDNAVGEITVGQLGYDKRRPYVFESLVKYINNLACGKGLKRITLRISFDPELMDILSSIGVHFQCNETYGGKGGNMLQIINLQSLFARLAPELEERLVNSVASNWSGVLEIEIEKDKVQLYIHRGKIEPVADQKPDIRLRIREVHLLKLILGLLDFAEIGNALRGQIELDSMRNALVNDLFPRKPVYSGNWG